MPTIHEQATLTSKGQVTLPRSIRQALGVQAGSKVNFELLPDGRIIVSRTPDEHQDPVIGAFLTLLAQDIQAGRNVQGLPEDLAHAMLAHAEHCQSSDEEIDGDVAL